MEGTSSSSRLGAFLHSQTNAFLDKQSPADSFLSLVRSSVSGARGDSVRGVVL